MREKRLDEFIKNHEKFVQELLEFAKNEPESFKESIAEIIRVISDYKALSNRVQELEESDRNMRYNIQHVINKNKRYREILNRIRATTNEGTIHRWAHRALEDGE